MDDIDSLQRRLTSLGLKLPAVPRPVANYVPAVRSERLVYTSGQLPSADGTVQYCGKLGLDLDEKAGYEAARLAGLNALAAVLSLVDRPEDIIQIVRVTGYVNSAPGFVGQSAVINGASDLLAELFGPAGRHTRAAVGVAELPLNAAVEIDLIVELKA
ncbi:MAG: hypothetical protein DLM70_01705 [Chloroflexi bacterium]|nr:MAG: hypothetical protein DLM70_01705 [Chloroflexota bacterium]